MKSSIRISPGWIGSIRSALVVVDKFDIFCTSFSPYKTESPLRVDANAVLATSIADESLQPISRRDPEVFEVFRRVDQLEFS